ATSMKPKNFLKPVFQATQFSISLPIKVIVGFNPDGLLCNIFNEIPDRAVINYFDKLHVNAQTNVILQKIPFASNNYDNQQKLILLHFYLNGSIYCTTQNA
ncbi:12200_t:CDS:2, partial [Gigaspora rosea]